MSRCLVTGVAGFIGSSVAARLIKDGHQVTGIDCLTDYYSIVQKKHNLKDLLPKKDFIFYESDLMTADLKEILRDIEYVFHFAAHAGVRDGFGRNFELYVRNNILIIKRLLDACKDIQLKKFVYASSSSIYGQQSNTPTKEDAQPKPISLYGATKLTCENICDIYCKTFGIPIITLRFFSVYGPRQRPDMAFHKFLKAIIHGDTIVINGDGKQSRDFTFIEDIVDMNMLAMQSPLWDEVFNVGRGKTITIEETIDLMRSITKAAMKVEYLSHEAGDVANTLSDTLRAVTRLGYDPKWDLADGIALQYEWLKNFYDS